MGPVAAIDCGTNSTRLLVADGGGRPLERLMEITRLGAGVDETHRLDPAAIDRTVAVLRRYRAVMDGHGVARVRITATSAARDAANRSDFFAAAEAAVGAVPELLGGDAEGALSFAGATADLDLADGPWLVADIGGGSTELAAGPAPSGDRLTPLAVRSIDVGCVRLTERVLTSDPPTAAQVTAARSLAATLVAEAAEEVPLLSVGRRLVLPAATVAALATGLAGEDAAARRQRPGMEPGRADVIVGGVLVLDAILRHFAMDGCLTSESDILDGLVMSMLA